MMSRAKLGLLAATTLMFTPLVEGAQNFPVKPITVVVPYNPGGTNDIIARVVAQKMSQDLGQNVIVENRPGAGGNIGSAAVARAEPDGYTILIASSGVLAINKWLYRDVGYDAQTDFAPISLAGHVPNVLLVNPDVPAKDVKELIEYARHNPDKMNFASMGTGTSGHLGGEMLKQMADIDIQHVPYAGSAPALTALLGGQVQMMFDNLPTALPHVQSGKLRAFGVTSLERSPSLPDVPSMAEAGVDDFEATAWFGFVAPAKTPDDVVRQLSAGIMKALKDPDVQKRLEGQGVLVSPNSPEEFKDFMQSESEKWGAIVKRAGLKPQ